MTAARGWRWLGVSLGAACLVLAGCDQSIPNGGDDDRSPLEIFFDWDSRFGGDREFTEEERQQHYQVQESIVECMQEAGFEYWPEPFWGDDESRRDLQDAGRELSELQGSDPEAFVKRYGYGISTTVIEEERDPSDDSNWTYREGLSEAAQEAYDIALNGDGQADGAGRWDPLVDGGCRDRAEAEMYGGEPSPWSLVWVEIGQLENRVRNDPRMVEARQQWSDCMARAGYPGLERLSDGGQQVQRRLDEVYGTDSFSREERDVPAPTPAGTEEDAAGEPFQPDPADVAEVRDFELAIAWADYQCQQEQDLDRIEREVRYMHETQFIEDHRELLSGYRDYLDEMWGEG